MSHHEGNDLSALDPTGDPAHWEAFVAATLARADTSLKQRALRTNPLVVVASWQRPLLVMAAVIVSVLIPVEIVLELREDDAERLQHLVQLSGDVAWGGALPTGAELLSTLTGQRLP